VAALPALTGRVEGRAFEGDHATPARSAQVQVKSLGALFARTWTTYTGTQGEFALAGQITDSSTSMPIPVGVPVRITATHGFTQLAAPTYTASFGDGATVVSQDVVFPSGVVTGRILSPPDFTIHGYGNAVQAYRNNAAVNGIAYIDADGTYTFPGLQAGTYQMRLWANHDQGTGLQGSVDNVIVTVGATTTADIPVQPTGSVAGTVRLASGATAGPYQSIRLVGISGTSASRSTYTDAAGHYALTAVPIGRYALSVVDSRNGATVTVTIDVGAGQLVNGDFVLPGTGTVQLTANYARGGPAPSAAVYLSAPSIPGERWIGYTSVSGRIDIPVPVGAYSLRVTHPRANWRTQPFDSAVTGTLATDGQVVTAVVSLKAVADVRVTVLNADAGNAPISSAQVYISDARASQIFWGYTNAAGQLMLTGVPEGSFTVNARLGDGRSFGKTGTITTANDGQTVDVTVAVSYQLDVLGVLSFNGERRLYAVTANPGDVLSVSAFGEAHGGQPALYLTHTFVYDPDKTLVAYGYMYPGAGNYQYSELGNLSAIPIAKAGTYTVAVEAYYQYSPYDLGAFRLIAQIGGVQTAAGGYPGGSVQGRVFKADGTTPAAPETMKRPMPSERGSSRWAWRSWTPPVGPRSGLSPEPT